MTGLVLIQSGEGMQEWFGMWFALCHILSTRDVAERLPNADLFQHQLDFWPQGAGGDGDGIGRCGILDELSHTGENDEVILDGRHIGGRFLGH